ncbi:MAG: FAD-binding protein, partial [Saprospiraceae bacterium]|nr:FAD-binding protein [Saprospiraceae bacterium]
MIHSVEIKLFSEQAADEAVVRSEAIRRSGIAPARVREVRVIKRSIDARGSRPFFLIKAE